MIEVAVNAVTESGNVWDQVVPTREFATDINGAHQLGEHLIGALRIAQHRFGGSTAIDLTIIES